MRQKRYDSDLTDSQWDAIKFYFPDRRRRHNLRQDILDAILYLLKTGCQWRMLPGEFAPWQTVYYYLRSWREDGRLQAVLSAVRRTVRRQAGRQGEPSLLLVDCQSVSTSRAGGIAGFDAYKRVYGRKRHIAVDTQGLLWSVVVHAANDHETQWLLHVLRPVAWHTERIEAVWGDSAYRGDIQEAVHEQTGWSLKVAQPPEDRSGFAVEPKRWIVERTFSWLGGWRRLARDYEHHTGTSETMIRLAMLKVALNRLC